AGGEERGVREGHGRDSLELLRIQSNLSTLAVSLRDMMEQAAVPTAAPDRERLVAWQNTLFRLREDLTQAIETERTLAPLRPPGQQQELTDNADRLRGAIDRAFTLLIHGHAAGAPGGSRSPSFARHAERAASGAQFPIPCTP